MKIIEDNLTHPAVRQLLALHLQDMEAQSPKDTVYALDLSGLEKGGVTVWTLWQDKALWGCGALHELSPVHSEIKSMRTHPDHLRKGAAARLLTHMITIARQRRYKTLSLETGTHKGFAPAITLYKKFGFKSGSAFAGYKTSPQNQFFHLEL